MILSIENTFTQNFQTSKSTKGDCKSNMNQNLFIIERELGSSEDLGLSLPNN